MGCTYINSNNSFVTTNVLFLSNTPPKKWGVTILAVTALGVGILGIAYGTFGFTPLAQTGRMFIHMSAFEYGAVIVIGSAISSGALGVLFFVHKSRTSVISPDSNVLEAINEVSPLVDQSDPHLEAVKKFLCEGYCSYLDYYAFYHHLSILTESVCTDRLKMADWESFLEKIDKTQVVRRDGRATVQIDCKMELDRLKGTQLETAVEELFAHSDTIDKDLVALNQICRNAFPWKGGFSSRGLPREYFFGNKKGSTPTRSFVIRNKLNGEILGLIVFKENLLADGRTALFFHSLARKPCAVKMKMAEKLINAPNLSLYSKVSCEVLRENLPAQRIYQSLNFKISEIFDDYFVMVLSS